MKDWKKSAAACFLHKEFGGETPYEAIAVAIERLLEKFPTESAPVRPSRYATWCRTEPEPVFVRMSLEGALKLDTDHFRILIRDATSNLELSFQDTFEAARLKPARSCQLEFDFASPEILSTPFYPNLNNVQIMAGTNASNIEVMECQYNSTISQYALRRQRFTYAHELCHTLFFDLKAQVPYRPYKYIKGVADTIEESLCNFGAGLLLMPDSLIKRFTRQDHSISEWLNSFCSEFDVSLQAAVVRLAACNHAVFGDDIVILSKYSENKFTGRDKKFRVRASIVPPALRKVLFIPENSGIEKLGLKSLSNFGKARFDMNKLCGKRVIDTLDFRGFKQHVECVHERMPGYSSVIVSCLCLLD